MSDIVTSEEKQQLAKELQEALDELKKGFVKVSSVLQKLPERHDLKSVKIDNSFQLVRMDIESLVKIMSRKGSVKRSTGRMCKIY